MPRTPPPRTRTRLQLLLPRLAQALGREPDGGRGLRVARRQDKLGRHLHKALRLVAARVRRQQRVDGAAAARPKAVAHLVLCVGAAQRLQLKSQLVLHALARLAVGGGAGAGGASAWCCWCCCACCCCACCNRGLRACCNRGLGAGQPAAARTPPACMCVRARLCACVGVRVRAAHGARVPPKRGRLRAMQLGVSCTWAQRPTIACKTTQPNRSWRRWARCWLEQQTRCAGARLCARPARPATPTTRPFAHARRRAPTCACARALPCSRATCPCCMTSFWSRCALPACPVPQPLRATCPHPPLPPLLLPPLPPLLPPALGGVAALHRGVAARARVQPAGRAAAAGGHAGGRAGARDLRSVGCAHGASAAPAPKICAQLATALSPVQAPMPACALQLSARSCPRTGTHAHARARTYVHAHAHAHAHRSPTSCAWWT